MIFSLSYATPKRRYLSKFAIAAFALGLASGPLQVAVIYLLSYSQSPFLNGFTIFATPIIALALNLAAAIHVRASSSLRGLHLTIAGALCSVAWPVALIFAFIHFHMC